jgi:hypothetical protein
MLADVKIKPELRAFENKLPISEFPPSLALNIRKEKG